jgi:hypothetical protein
LDNGVPVIIVDENRCVGFSSEKIDKDADRKKFRATSSFGIDPTDVPHIKDKKIFKSDPASAVGSYTYDFTKNPDGKPQNTPHSGSPVTEVSYLPPGIDPGILETAARKSNWSVDIATSAICCPYDLSKKLIEIAGTGNVVNCAEATTGTDSILVCPLLKSIEKKCPKYSPSFRFRKSDSSDTLVAVNSDVGLDVRKSRDEAMRLWNSRDKRFLTVGNDISSDLRGIIKFKDDGFVQNIWLERNGSYTYYNYVLYVSAQGPSKGCGHLVFTDADGDKYNLSIYSSSKKTHTVKYDSKKPKIVEVEWSSS